MFGPVAPVCGRSWTFKQVLQKVQKVLQMVPQMFLLTSLSVCSWFFRRLSEGSADVLVLKVLFVFYLLSPEFCSATRHTSVSASLFITHFDESYLKL